MTLADAFSAHAHQNHEQWNQGGGYQKQPPGGPAVRKYKGNNGGRNHYRQGKLRQIESVKIVQPFDMLQHRAGQSTTALTACIARAKGDNMR